MTQFHIQNSASAWDQKVRDACIQYHDTGAIGDVLLAGFDQHGRWSGLQQKTNGAHFPAAMTARLADEVVPEARRSKITPAGESVMLCSYHTEARGRVHLPFHRIAGGLRATKAMHFEAADLRSVGGDLALWSAKVVITPSLQKIGGCLWASSATRVLADRLESASGLSAPLARHLCLPRLMLVDGDLNVGDATRIDMPKLKYVLGDLDAGHAKRLELPELRQVEGDLLVNRAKSLNLPALLRVEGLVGANLAKTLHAPKLSVDLWHLSAPCAREFIRTNATGEKTLHASIRDETARAVYCDFAHILGDVVAYNASAFRAPNLVSVGGDLVAMSAEMFEAPRLGSVGGDLDTSSARDFWKYDFVCRLWYPHPEAHKDWMARKARDALRCDSTMEL